MLAIAMFSRFVGVGEVTGVHDDGKTVFLRGAFIGHAELLHDVQGGAIFGHGDGDDAREMRVFDGVAQSNARGFGGETAAPLVFRETPADLDFRNSVKFQRLQAAVADEAAVGFESQFPKAKAARAEMILLAQDRFADLIIGSRNSAIDVTHDVGVGENRTGRCEVSERPGSEPEAFGFEVMIHSTGL